MAPMLGKLASVHGPDDRGGTYFLDGAIYQKAVVLVFDAVRTRIFHF